MQAKQKAENKTKQERRLKIIVEFSGKDSGHGFERDWQWEKEKQHAYDMN